MENKIIRGFLFIASYFILIGNISYGETIENENEVEKVVIENKTNDKFFITFDPLEKEKSPKRIPINDKNPKPVNLGKGYLKEGVNSVFHFGFVGKPDQDTEDILWI